MPALPALSQSTTSLTITPCFGGSITINVGGVKYFPNADSLYLKFSPVVNPPAPYSTGVHCTRSKLSQRGDTKRPFTCKWLTFILCTRSLLANSSSFLLISIWWRRCAGKGSQLAWLIMPPDADIVFVSGTTCSNSLTAHPPPSPTPWGKWPGPGTLGHVFGGLSEVACVCIPYLGRRAHSWWSKGQQYSPSWTKTVSKRTNIISRYTPTMTVNDSMNPCRFLLA